MKAVLLALRGDLNDPEKMDKLAMESNVRFAVLENESDILENAESYHAVIPKPVESYISIVLDVSKSVIGDESDGTPPSVDLSALIGSLRTLVASMKPDAGEPRVAVAIYVFGRDVAPYVPFTEDFADLDQKLAAIEKDHSFLPDSIGIYGSDLYKAVSIGLNATQRIRDLRAAVSWDGILSTGTVVAITDGNDQSGGQLTDLTKQINNSLNQVISTGISDDVDDDILNAIGQDGSYLAPTP